MTSKEPPATEILISKDLTPIRHLRWPSCVYILMRRAYHRQDAYNDKKENTMCEVKWTLLRSLERGNIMTRMGLVRVTVGGLFGVGAGEI